MAASRVLGVTKVIFGGTDFGTRPGATIKLGGDKKTPQFGSGILAGFSHEPQACEFQGTLIVKGSTDTEKVRNYEGQIDFVCDTVPPITYSSADAVVDTADVELGPDGLKFNAMGTAAVKV
jgi:hypothetical protein